MRPELDGRNFVTVAEAAAVLDGTDPRTVRAAAKAGDIPSVQVGARRMIPAAWLRQQASAGVQAAAPEVDLEQLADRIADRVAARILGAFAALAPEKTNDRTSPGPAVASNSTNQPAARQGADRHAPA